MRTSWRPIVGNQPELHREDVLEQDREEEDGNRDPDERGHEARVVHHAAVAFGGEEPEGHAEGDCEDHRRDRELDRRREAARDLLGDRTPRGDARAEIALHELLEVLEVLDVDRPIEPVDALDLLDRLGRRPLAEQRLAGSPGSALIQRKTRIESPRRIGTSSSSRRTTKRSI